MKYKKCHLERDTQSAPSAWEVDSLIRNQRKNGKCLHVSNGSTCGKPAIASHTVPKAMLRKIARNGHIYYHSATIQDLEKTQGQLVVKPIGINDASTLPIFCQSHDSGIFSPLENALFTGSAEQCFLLAYRALCNEFSKKSGAAAFISTMKQMVDRGKPALQQLDIQSQINTISQSYNASMRDMNEHKALYESMLGSSDYSNMRAYILMLENTPDVLCSGAIHPEYDFAGKTLQNLADLDKKMELMTFSLIATDGGGAFVFAWHSNGDAVCKPLVASLEAMQDDAVPHAILRFIFEHCENHYIKPDWWDNIDQKAKNALTKRLETSASIWVKRRTEYLADDGLRTIYWKIASSTWL